MTTFDDREKAFEGKFAHDADLRFKVEMRRDKLLGLWAAQLIGLKAPAAAEYARELIRADLKEAGSEDVFAKLREDFDGRGLEVSDADIRKAMAEKLTEARRQVAAEVE